jgi:hypothetical protein
MLIEIVSLNTRLQTAVRLKGISKRNGGSLSMSGNIQAKILRYTRVMLPVGAFKAVYKGDDEQQQTGSGAER